MTLEQRMEQLAKELHSMRERHQDPGHRNWENECLEAYWEGNAVGMAQGCRIAYTDACLRIKDAIREQNSTHTEHMLKMAAAAHDLAKDIPCGIREARTIVEAAVGKLTDKEKAELAAQMEKLDESDERDQP